MVAQFSVGEVVKFFHFTKEKSGVITQKSCLNSGVLYYIRSDGKTYVVSQENIISEYYLDQMRDLDEHSRLVLFFKELVDIYEHRDIREFGIFRVRWKGVIVKDIRLLDTEEFKEVESFFYDRRKESKV